jgi:hypothetical protein
MELAGDKFLYLVRDNVLRAICYSSCGYVRARTQGCNSPWYPSQSLVSDVLGVKLLYRDGTEANTSRDSVFAIASR